jgi:hypothetical protein
MFSADVSDPPLFEWKPAAKYNFACSLNVQMELLMRWYRHFTHWWDSFILLR